jgi:uncharacterized protein DUF2793
MTDTSLILGLPYIQPSQAQRHVTHNEALRVLDALVQLSVEAVDQSSPPSNAEAGDRYVVAAPGLGAWAGRSTEIAVYDGLAWTFIAPQEGWQAYVRATGGQVTFDGTAWQAQGADAADTLGINAVADTTNRLTVSSDAVLLNHEGAGHQVKVNKATDTDTASLLFQTGFSGRAEMGIAGNDDFSIKVSADGGTWTEALRINAASGAVSLPQSAWREVLTGPRTYYVDPVAGDDANDGLSAGAGAFASIPRAVTATQFIDAGSYGVTIQLADATYALSAPLAFDKRTVGAPRVILQGNPAAPDQVVLDSTGAAVRVTDGAVVLRGVRVQSTSASDAAVQVLEQSTVVIDRVDFGSAPAGHIQATHGQIRIEGDYSISGNADFHIFLEVGAVVETLPGTVTLTGTPAFTSDYIQCWECSVARLGGLTFAGTATGRRYLATLNSTITTDEGGPTYLPGDTAGAVIKGGRYF